MMTTQTLYLIDEYLMQGGYTQGIDAETLESEAVLVAAAPDLLEALWQIVTDAEIDCDTEEAALAALADIRVTARNAIAKAKGA
jgi:hypothetical protein